MCQDLRTFQVYLDDNTSINIFHVQNSSAHKYLSWVFPFVSDLFLKNDDCACQKSLAIRTDGVLFQIILACSSFTAILGHLTA